MGKQEDREIESVLRSGCPVEFCAPLQNALHYIQVQMKHNNVFLMEDACRETAKEDVSTPR